MFPRHYLYCFVTLDVICLVTLLSLRCRLGTLGLVLFAWQSVVALPLTGH